MAKKDIFKTRLGSFTILEMLITLVIFSTTLIVLYNMMGMSLRMLNNNTGDSISMTQSLLLIKYLDMTLRDSYFIERETNGVLSIDTFDGRRLSIYSNRNILYIGRVKDGRLYSPKFFNLQGVKNLKFDVIKADRRLALSLSMQFTNRDMSRIFVLGYRK